MLLAGVPVRAFSVGLAVPDPNKSQQKRVAKHTNADIVEPHAQPDSNADPHRNQIYSKPAKRPLLRKPLPLPEVLQANTVETA